MAPRPGVEPTTSQSQVYNVLTVTLWYGYRNYLFGWFSILWVEKKAASIISSPFLFDQNTQDLLQSSRWRPAISGPEACSWSTSHTTWIHQICRDTGIPVTDALELHGLAEDKSFWRRITTTGCDDWTLRVTMTTIMMKIQIIHKNTAKTLRVRRALF